MPVLDFCLRAEQEFDELWESDEDAAALIDALLIQLEEDPRLLDYLCEEDRYLQTRPSFEVKRFEHLWRRKYTIYILKITADDGGVVGHRVVYAHHPQRDIYYVLALMDREIDYDADKDFINRICADYDDYQIPRY